MVSPIILFTISVYWAKYSPTHLIDTHPRLFFWAMGAVFSNIAVSFYLYCSLNFFFKRFGQLKKSVVAPLEGERQKIGRSGR